MAQANAASSTRRDFVRLATAAGMATAAFAPDVAAAFDPIFAAIEAHKAAYREEEAACIEQSELELLLPKRLRQTDFCDWGTELVIESDDPRWLTNQRRVFAAHDAIDDAAIALLNLSPATAAGLSALLRYAYEFVIEGNEWPDRVIDVEGVRNDDSARNVDFSTMLHSHAADAVDALAGGW